jgi:hypothetical protein
MPEPKQRTIFLSCGTPHNQAQEDFIAAVEAHLESHSCTPETVGRSKYSARQPVEASRDLISTCDGLVVIAFERTRILTGLEKPDSINEKQLLNESHPTVWNQMEAAMAYSRRVPILTLVQPGLKRQGMLSDRLEWMAVETELTPLFLATEHFRQVFSEWISTVDRRRTEPSQLPFDPAELTVGNLVSQLRAKQVGALAVIIFGLFGGVATAAFKAGQYFTPRDQQSLVPITRPAPTSASSK